MENKTAKIVRFHALGGPEVLKIEEVPIPEPGKGEVRLKVNAIGLNRAESQTSRSAKLSYRCSDYLRCPVCVHQPAT